MNDPIIQWHSGFTAAIDLELADYRKCLTYLKEHNLNSKPLQIDLVVIKKVGDIQIFNEIGRFFRGHNIMEYKSPEDHLDIDTFYKSGAYASLYKSYGETLDERPADDITVSIIREAKPVALFRYFHHHKIPVSNPFQGIYYVMGNTLFPTQIIVTKELSSAEHVWLKALSANLKKDDMANLLNKIETLKLRFDRELADSVLEISIQANKDIVNELKGDDLMCQALLEIMEPEINKITETITESVTASVREATVTNAIKSFREFGINDLQIKDSLIKNFQLTSNEAEAFLLKTP